MGAYGMEDRPVGHKLCSSMQWWMDHESFAKTWTKNNEEHDAVQHDREVAQRQFCIGVAVGASITDSLAF